ncbi:universal stress protein [Streptomyces sp. SID13666]|uniref:universal stress protein n=1 Tax=unclassified Streptomyces TaxID=2593676 RepID=UPI0013BEE89D|nr:universal stress protein [Streptomyces sp. SID13666]NEA72371.1 universal stress protein [Streptomyces sp. SID13588]
MELPVVVGVDGSEAGLEAVDWAADEAVRQELPLRLVHASLWEHYEGMSPSFGDRRPSERVRAENIIAEAVERAEARQPGLKISSNIIVEGAVTALVEESVRAYAVVVGHRGRGELTGLLLGSVGLGVAARARGPVIVVRGAVENRQDAYHRVLLGVSGVSAADASVDFAFRAADRRGARVEAVHAWRCPDHESTASFDTAREHLRRAETTLTDAVRDVAALYPKVTVDRVPVEGLARKALLDAAVTADLLVVGAQRRQGRSLGLQLGLVNHALLHHAACPVAVVPQP